MNSRQNACVVDLDGTLLHPEPAGIPVRGSSGYRYMSTPSAELLRKLGQLMPLVIATGRNARSVHRLVSRLTKVRFAGFVLENGMVVRKRLMADAGNGSHWDVPARQLPGWKRLDGYENCLGLIIPPDIEAPEAIIRNKLESLGKTGVLYREKHKMFVYPFAPGKLPGLKFLGLHPFIAIGDEINDLDMLKAGTHPATPAGANEQARACVAEKAGYNSPLSSHAGTEDLLKWAVRTATNDSCTDVRRQ